MKPVSMLDLPGPLLESFLWDMQLDYCPYESSKEITIRNILLDPNGCISSNNDFAIRNFWIALSEEDFQRRVDQVLTDLQATILAVKCFQKS